jgi:hypothetical protein
MMRLRWKSLLTTGLLLPLLPPEPLPKAPEYVPLESDTIELKVFDNEILMSLLY